MQHYLSQKYCVDGIHNLNYNSKRYLGFYDQSVFEKYNVSNSCIKHHTSKGAQAEDRKRNDSVAVPVRSYNTEIIDLPSINNTNH